MARNAHVYVGGATATFIDIGDKIASADAALLRRS